MCARHWNKVFPPWQAYLVLWVTCKNLVMETEIVINIRVRLLDECDVIHHCASAERHER